MATLDPERSLGFLVRRCHRRFDRILNARLNRHDLKSGFWYYLRALWVEDDVTQKRLSDLTNVTETTTVSTINGMIGEGLVTREKDKFDRRKVRVKLTPTGRELESELIGYAVEINDIAIRGIPAAQVSTCIDVLRRMSENLQEAFSEQPNMPSTASTAD